MIAWAWDAGDGDPVSNTDGSITSTVKASTTNGFSIVSYTGNGTAGATIGHGLSSAPDMMIVRRRTVASGWMVYHSANTANPETEYLSLQATDATTDDNTRWNDTAPTSSVFSVGTAGATNASGSTYIAYCWHDVTGKQKFGSYTGTGSAPSALVNTGFRPGWLMIKESDGVDGWGIYDGSRNPLNPVSQLLQAQDSSAESNATANYVDFESNGFKVCTGGSNGNFLNESGKTYIYAAFAGSYSDYITDYNTDGSIDSRVKANDTTGFSIVSYTGNGTSGATIGHGLTTAPDFVVIKNRDTTQNWYVFHESIGATKYLLLDSDVGEDTSSTVFNNTAPSASVVTLGSWVGTNAASNDMIAYCWAEKTGYSKFGSYSGGTDGTSVTGLGFKPALVIVKPSAGGTGGWRIYDNTRDVTNPTTKVLIANNSNAEADSSNSIDIDADGFTLNGTSTAHNGSGYTYIYAAFADTREAAFWLDQSGNDNDWQPVNLDHNDTVADSPTDNFCVFNPLKKQANTVLSDGNLKVSSTDTGSAYCQFTTIAMPSGKYYAEFTINTASGNYPNIGIGDLVISENVNQGLGDATYGAGYQANGTVRVGGTTIGTSFPTFTVGDVISVAYDADNNRVYFAKNGTWINSGDPTAGTGYFSPAAPVDGYVFASSTYSVGSFTANFGQQPFKYDPPA